MEEIVKVITNVGFPIAVSVYLLIRFESKIESLSNAIATLTNNINVLTIKIGEHDKVA